MDCRDAAEKERDTVISLRRHFHENPELSQKEFRTMDFIEKFLHELGIETVMSGNVEEPWNNFIQHVS